MRGINVDEMYKWALEEYGQEVADTFRKRFPSESQ